MFFQAVVLDHDPGQFRVLKDPETNCNMNDIRGTDFVLTKIERLPYRLRSFTGSAQDEKPERLQFMLSEESNSLSEMVSIEIFLQRFQDSWRS